MQVRIARDDLVEPAKIIASMMTEPGQAAVPILSHLVIRTDVTMEHRKLVVSACDMNAAVEFAIDAEIKAEGATTLEARSFARLLRDMKRGSMLTIRDIPADDCYQWVHLETDGSRQRFAGLPIDDYPTLAHAPFGKRTATVDLPAAELRGLIDRTKHAISTEETRYYLNGICFHDESDPRGRRILRAVATDGHRLAINGTRIDMTRGRIDRPILERTAVRTLRSMINSYRGKVSMVFNEKIGDFALEPFDRPPARLLAKWIDGVFPDYERIVAGCDAGERNQLEVLKSDLQPAIERIVAAFPALSKQTGEKQTPAVHMRISRHNVEMSAQYKDDIRQERISCSWSGKPRQGGFNIGFNGLYMIAALRATDADIVWLDMADGGDPVVVRPKTADGTRGLDFHIVMPMRTMPVSTVKS